MVLVDLLEQHGQDVVDTVELELLVQETLHHFLHHKDFLAVVEDPEHPHMVLVVVVEQVKQDLQTQMEVLVEQVAMVLLMFMHMVLLHP